MNDLIEIRAEIIFDKLKKRGILEQALAVGAKHHSFTYKKKERTGLNFPLTNPVSGDVVGYFWKNAVSNESPKYLPVKLDGSFGIGTDSGFEWYTPNPDGIKTAIQDNNGVVYIANGIPSLLAYRAAGVMNVIAGRAETYPPKNLLEVLQFFGVTRVVFVIDNDFAGYLAAKNWRDALRSSGLDYQAYTWGKSQKEVIHTDNYGNETPFVHCADIANKADGNDIWIDTGFNPELFQALLDNLTPLKLPAPPETGATEFDSSVFENTPQGLIDAILNAAAARGYKGRKGKKFINGCCLFHAEKQPSAGISLDSGVLSCFVCGSHSHYDVAEALGIHWESFYPKHEKSVKREKPTETDYFKAALDRVQSENRIHIRYLWQEYERGSYTSFYGVENLPLSILSALLNLTDTRSSTVLVMGRIHVKLLSGDLPPIFTITDVCNTTGLDRRTVKTGLNDLLEFNYIQFVATDIIDNYVLQQTVQNKKRGRKPQYYAISPLEVILETIPLRLYYALTVFFTEKIHRQSLCELTPEIVRAFDLAYDDAKKAKELVSVVMDSDKLSQDDSRKLRKELEGDNERWGGWLNALYNMGSVDIDWMNCGSIKDVRFAILHQWIQKRDINSQEELSRVIGCSSTTLASIYADYDVVSEPRWHNAEMTIQQVGHDLRQTTRQLQAKHRGSVWAIRFHRQYKKEWESVNPEYAAIHYYKTKDGVPNNPDCATPIDKVFIQLRLPSRQRMMTPDEIAERDKKLAETAEKEAKTVDKSKLSATVEKAPEKRQIRRNYSKPSRQWKTLGFEFLYAWTRTYAALFTDSYLEMDTLKNKTGEVVFQSNDLGAIIRHVTDNAKTKKGKPLRTCAQIHANERVKDIEKYDSELKALFVQQNADILAELEADEFWDKIRVEADKVSVPF